jgi:hypothetical protein
MRIRILGTLALLALASGFAGPAGAIPALQLYIDGASWDTVTETWQVTAPTFDLWVIGDVGHYGTIFDVKLAVAYNTGDTGALTLTGKRTTRIQDLSTPGNPAYQSFADGIAPVTGDGSSLPGHGVYGVGHSFRKYFLGDFTSTDSKIGDFNGDLPFPTAFPDLGQINVYEVAVTGFTGGLHFDTYNHVAGRNGSEKYVTAPFSHDAGASTPEDVPEPGALVLFGTVMIGAFGVGLRRRRR